MIFDLPLLSSGKYPFSSNAPIQSHKFSPHYRCRVKYFGPLNHHEEFFGMTDNAFHVPLEMTSTVNLWLCMIFSDHPYHFVERTVVVLVVLLLLAILDLMQMLILECVNSRSSHRLHLNMNLRLILKKEFFSFNITFFNGGWPRYV